MKLSKLANAWAKLMEEEDDDDNNDNDDNNVDNDEEKMKEDEDNNEEKDDVDKAKEFLFAKILKITKYTSLPNLVRLAQ